jgi:hypothetical protein
MKTPIHTFSVNKPGEQREENKAISPEAEEALRAMIGIFGDYNLSYSEQAKILVAMLGVARDMVRQRYGVQAGRDYTDFLARTISRGFGVDLFMAERKKRRAPKNK